MNKFKENIKSIETQEVINKTINNKKIIPIFFASDNNYVPFLAVAIKSLLENASKDYFYNIHILTDEISKENQNRILELETNYSKIYFKEISSRLERIKGKLHSTLRDYYTESIFYRLFIATMYPEYKKAIYLDCDIVVIGDISKMYEIDLKDNILGAIVDEVVSSNESFKDYVKYGVGVEYNKYFNSGVLLMNLEEYQKQAIKERFLFLLLKYNFETVAPDQDYLNILCKNKVLYLDNGWDKMSVDENFKGKINIIHYNNFRKPWYYNNVPYENYFWQYSKKTNFYNDIIKIKNNFTQSQAQKHLIGAKNLVDNAIRILNSDNNFCKTLRKVN